MKFSPFNLKERKVLNIPVPKKGINLTKSTLNLEDGEIGFSKNVLFENQSLKTRKGIVGSTDNIFYYPIADGADDFEVKMTDCECEIEGEKAKIATVKANYNASNIYILVYGLLKTGSIVELGNMHFMRNSDTVFYVPENILFFNSKLEGNNDVLAFITKRNLSDSKIEYEILKYNNELGFWSKYNSYYVPTVYINGRGNFYETAKGNYQVSSSKPIELERQNLLDGTFNAYYSSDGYSTVFKLPYTDIDNSTVKITVNTSLTQKVTWTIIADSSTDTQTVFGGDITAYINRKTGAIYFMKESTAFSIPIIDTYKENNIKITASKTNKADYGNIVSCTICTEFNGRLIFSGGREKNKVYYSTVDNPLYFPKLNNNEIGSCNDSIKGLYKYKNHVYSFKENEIFRMTLNKGKILNNTAILQDDGRIFKETDSFSYERTSNYVGLKDISTLMTFIEDAVWVGNDNKIYTFNSGNIERISEKIEPFLKMKLVENDNLTFCACDDRGYYLVLGENIVFIDMVLGYTAYIWEIPEAIKVCGITKIENELIFICKNVESNIFYTAKLKGEQDVIVLDQENTKNLNIPTKITFKSHYLSQTNRKKYVHTAYFKLGLNENTKIIIGTALAKEQFDIRKGDFSTNCQDTVKLLCDLKGIESIDLCIESSGALSFFEADIYFTEMGII